MTRRRIATAAAVLAALVVAVSVGAHPSDVQADDMAKSPLMTKVPPMAKLPNKSPR